MPLEAPSLSAQRRKFSFPLQTSLGERSDLSAARRRFSNVSDAVSRKLSHTIGWLGAPGHHVVHEGRALCACYIRGRLRRAGISSRRCGLQRVRGTQAVVRDVFPDLAGVGGELERMYPKLFVSVARQASPAPGGVLAGDKSAGLVLSAVARELLKQGDVSWAKVVALFAVAGGLAVDCARQNHPDYARGLPEAMGAVLEEELAPWIVNNGGWQGLLAHLKPHADPSPPRCALALAAVAAVALLLVLLLRLCVYS